MDSRANGKPLRRTRLQQAAKDASRRRIIEAGKDVFDEYGYMQTAVEDIRVRAKVSRTTFYKHFAGKYELAEAIAEDLSLTTSVLLSPESDGIEELKGAIATLFGKMRERPTLMRAFAELVAVEPSWFQHSLLGYGRSISHLAKRFPAFARAEARRDADPQLWLEACLTLRELERTAFDCVIYNSYEYPDEILITVLATRLHRFLND